MKYTVVRKGFVDFVKVRITCLARKYARNTFGVERFILGRTTH